MEKTNYRILKRRGKFIVQVSYMDKFELFNPIHWLVFLFDSKYFKEVKWTYGTYEDFKTESAAREYIKIISEPDQIIEV